MPAGMWCSLILKGEIWSFQWMKRKHLTKFNTDNVKNSQQSRNGRKEPHWGRTSRNQNPETQTYCLKSHSDESPNIATWQSTHSQGSFPLLSSSPSRGRDTRNERKIMLIGQKAVTVFIHRWHDDVCKTSKRTPKALPTLSMSLNMKSISKNQLYHRNSHKQAKT